MFKEPAYWMYYFWSKNKRARKDKAVISNATWTMAILWFLNLTALHLLFEAWGWDMLTGWFSSLTDKVEWSRFNPVAYLFAAAMLAPFIWIARKLYYRPAKLKAMQAKYETMGKYRKLLGQCLFWLYITGSFASFFIIACSLSYFKIANMLNKYENSLDTSDCLGNTQQDKILEQEKDTVTPTEHEEIYENDVTPPTGNHIINTVADLLLQPNAVIMPMHRNLWGCLK